MKAPTFTQCRICGIKLVGPTVYIGTCGDCLVDTRYKPRTVRQPGYTHGRADRDRAGTRPDR